MSNQMLTLARGNQFSFICPMMNAEVKMRGCVILRDLVYQGKQVKTRRGCQACIRSGKCPAAEIVRRVAFGSDDMTDHCGSVDPVVGKIPADVLERIRPIIVKDSDLSSLSVVGEERDLIDTANARIDAQIATAPRATIRQRQVIRSATTENKRSSAPAAREVAPRPRTTADTTMLNAAVSGDLSAAINA